MSYNSIYHHEETNTDKRNDKNGYIKRSAIAVHRQDK